MQRSINLEMFDLYIQDGGREGGSGDQKMFCLQPQYFWFPAVEMLFEHHLLPPTTYAAWTH